MPDKFVVGVNTAMFDGWDLETTFSVIKTAGFDYVELAWNQGYVGNLNPELFSDENAEYVLSLLEKFQLKMHALGCTIPLSGANAIEEFSHRIHFAGKLGVRFMNISPGNKTHYSLIVENLKILAPLAEAHHCFICLENGGDPNYDFITDAREGFAALEAIAHPSVALNVDPGNTVSMHQMLDPQQEALDMLPQARHFHIKDVKRAQGSYHFPAIGQGDLHYDQLLNLLEEKKIPCSLEIPLRMYRGSDTFPMRAEQVVALTDIRTTLARSKAYIENTLGHSL
ncbi:sugar phosphate isomerase/epimerase [Citrobacter freundii]|nr:sugar phosphate isomerase/epimerase [Citrobacter freundii]